MSQHLNQTDLPFDSIIRVSRVGGRDDMMSPDVQRAENAAAAARHGVRLAKEFREMNTSGGEVLDRRGLGEAVQRALDGETAGIIVPRLDRFARNLFDATVVMRRLDKAKRLLISNAEGVVVGPDVTTQSAMTRDFMIRMAQAQREQLKEQLDAARKRAIEGYGINLQIPYGYRRGEGRGRERRLLPDEHEAPAVVRMFELRAAGTSWSAIASELNASGIARPRKVTHWTHSAVKRTIQNRVYLGEARVGGVTKIDEDGDKIVSEVYCNAKAHEPLVSVDLWERANELRQTSKRRDTHYLLAGLIRCRSCGVRMRGNMDRERQIYRCRMNHSFGRCPAPTRIRADVIEPQVEALFAQEFRGIKGRPTASDDGELADAEALVEKRARQLETYASSTEYADLWDEQPAIAEAAIAARRERLREAGADVERLTAQRRGYRMPHDVVQAWPRYSTEQKRRYLAFAYGAISFNADGRVVVWREDEVDELDLPRAGHMALRPLPIVDHVPGRAGKEPS